MRQKTIALSSRMWWTWSACSAACARLLHVRPANSAQHHFSDCNSFLPDSCLPLLIQHCGWLLLSGVCVAMQQRGSVLTVAVTAAGVSDRTMHGMQRNAAAAGRAWHSTTAAFAACGMMRSRGPSITALSATCVASARAWGWMPATACVAMPACTSQSSTSTSVATCPPVPSAQNTCLTPTSHIG